MLGVVGSSLKYVKFGQQNPTCRNRVAKRSQHVAPNNVALTCCDRLAGALYILHPSVTPPSVSTSILDIYMVVRKTRQVDLSVFSFTNCCLINLVMNGVFGVFLDFKSTGDINP